MKNIGAICILLFVFLMGLMGGVIWGERSKVMSVRGDVVPPIEISGLSDSYSIGDIVTLSIKDATYPPNSLEVHYDWKVIDPNQPNKNIVRSHDGTTINFGTGNKPGKITVIVNESVVIGAKDLSGNIKGVDLQTSGMTTFDVNVK